MGSPKVIIATPVSCKLTKTVQWTLEDFWEAPDWLKAVLAQDYPDFEVFILANDLERYMLKDLRGIMDSRCKLHNHGKTGWPKDRRGSSPRRVKGKGEKEKYTKFAIIRNLVLDRVLKSDAVYFVSIDSDIIVHPDMVSRLVALMEAKPEYGIIAGIVNNSRRVGMTIKYPKAKYNFDKRDFKRGTFFDVNYTGACCIIRMAMLQVHAGVRWGAHVWGEDLYFCEQVKTAGFKVGVDSSIVTLHRMDNIVWRGDVKAFESRNFI